VPRLRGISVDHSALACLFAALVASTSCSGKAASGDAGAGAAGSDGADEAGAGGADGPSDLGAPNGDAPGEGPLLSHGACDLFQQDCPDVSRCDFFCDGASASIGCRPGATGAAVGEACSGTQPCARGTGCLANAATGTICRPYCQTDADCAVGRCHVVNVAVGCAPDAGSTTLVIKFCF
jgi:hypothetical protein